MMSLLKYGCRTVAGRAPKKGEKEKRSEDSHDVDLDHDLDFGLDLEVELRGKGEEVREWLIPRYKP